MPEFSLRPALLYVWSGPALAAIGCIVLGAIFLRPGASESPLAWWIVNSALTLERLLPLIGMGAALGMVGPRSHATGFALFAIGIASGFVAQNWLLALLIKVPQAPMHHFLTGPIAMATVGIALISGARLRPIVLPTAALITGTVTALAIAVTDPSLHDPTNAILGVSIALWMAGSVSLTVRAFRRPWFNFFAPILGSWLIAIGTLYGGAALIAKRVPPMTEPAPMPDLAQPLSDGDQSRRGRDTLPGMRDFQQP